MNLKQTPVWMSVMLIVALTLSACASATPTAAPAPKSASPTEAPKTAPTAAPQPTKGPTVGGNFVILVQTAVDSLDHTKAVAGLNVLSWVNSSLLALDPSGKIVPYLAKSWTISPDGLTYQFTLRDDVKFHNGVNLTADDYVWTIKRILDPATKSYCANLAYQGTKSVEVVDATTFKLTLAAPNYYYLGNLIGPCGAPVSKAYAESAGDNLAKAPVGTGPFKFKEWQPGVKVVLERNPDFNWGPAYTHGGPVYFQTVEYRQVADTATLLAAIEANQANWAGIDNANGARIKGLGTHTVAQVVLAGSINSLIMNVTRPPLDDIRVRKAINMAIDRQVLIQVVAGGAADPLMGALTSNTAGYCADADAVKLGNGYDLAKAKALMREAGYTYGSDGMLTKDGKPLTMTMPVFAIREKLSTVLQEQLKALGIAVVLNPGDMGKLVGDLGKGDFDLFAGGLNFNDASTLNYMFNSALAAGPTNASKIKDPDLDKLLVSMMTTTDAAINQKAACDAQKNVVEKAYTVPLYADKMSAAISKNVQGVRWANPSLVELYDAYFVSNQ